MDNRHILSESRRRFIKHLSLGSLTLNPAINLLVEGTSGAHPDHTITYFLIRPADLLCLQFAFENCSHCLGSLHAHSNARVTIRLPQLHVAEQNFDPGLLTGDPVQARMDIADFSYIVYKLKKGHIPLNPEKWLSWDSEDKEGIFGPMVTAWQQGASPSLGSGATPAMLTRFEFPFGLWLSPISNPNGGNVNGSFEWDHKIRLKDSTYKNRSELWTSSIRFKLPPSGTTPDVAPSDPIFFITQSLPKLAGGSQCKGGPPDFDNAVLPTKCDRDLLYGQVTKDATGTWDQRVKTNNSFFQLSPYGVTTKLLYKPGYGAIDIGKVVEWKQQSSLGRDTYVEVVTSGWIFPYMIRCNFAQITRRVTMIKYKDATPHPQTMLIISAKFKRSQLEVVYEDAMSTAGITNMKAAPRGLPFSSVRLLTAESPEFSLGKNFIYLDSNSPTGQLVEKQGIGEDNPHPIWTVRDYDQQLYYSFDFEGTDHNGSIIKFSSPFIFIPDPMPKGTCRAEVNPGNTLDLDTICKHFIAETLGNIYFPAGPAGPGAAANFPARNRAVTNSQVINYIKNDDSSDYAAKLDPLKRSAATLQTEYLVFTSWPKPPAIATNLNNFTPVSNLMTGTIPFFPIVEKAHVVYPPLKDFIPPGLSGSLAQDMCYPAVYLVYGIYQDPNAKGMLNQPKVFLKFYKNSISMFGNTALLELAAAVTPVAGDIVTGNVTGAFGTFVSMDGNTLNLTDVTGVFSELDTMITFKSGQAGAPVVSYTGPDLKKVGSLIRPTLKAAAISLINGIVSTGEDSLAEELSTVLATADLPSDFRDAIQNFIGHGLQGLPTFSPKDFLPDMKILGQDINVAELITDSPIGDFITEAQDAASRFMPIIQTIRDTKSITAQFQWTVVNQRLVDISILHWLYNDNNGVDSSLALSCTQVIPIASGTANTTASCVLKNFALDFFEFVTVDFSEFSYTNSSDGGTKVSVKVSDVEFGGSLSFVNMLASLLQSLEDALNIALEAAMIQVSYALPIPSISLPCFSMENIKIDTGINIPLDIRSTSLSFGFNSIKDPFTISVAVFGGGGSVRSTFDTKGIIDFAASFEFGGYFGLDIVVAEGCVYLFAGMYFDSNGSNCIILGAYIRCGGDVTVLDLIDISVTFYLGLQYQDDNNQTLLTGTCTITVSISIAFFSIDVPLTYRKDLAGSAAGTNANIASDCISGDTASGRMLDGTLAGPNIGMAGWVPPTAKKAVPPPALNGKPYKNERIPFQKHMNRRAWAEYIDSFAS